MQLFKTIYFADHPAPAANRKNLKVAFGPTDALVYERVASMSSADVRQAIGVSTFHELSTRALAADRTVNAFCVERLRHLVTEGCKVASDTAQSLDGTELDIDPIQTTFRGGIAEPLHDWYPYLEGYSPDFVTSVLAAFAPGATRVLDPFGGSGTTPLAIAKRGGQGYYCELNPLMQFLIETKVGVVTLTSDRRASLVALLHSLVARMQPEVSASERDSALQASYLATFGDSEFFPFHTLDMVLRIRTWIDRVTIESPEAAAIITVAAFSSLLPCSNLIRRGDVRFRKGPNEVATRIDDYLQDVSARIVSMAATIGSLYIAKHRPLLVTGDAKRLGRATPLGIDAIVTSPPYLNGTNYYRNTKVELWFLRALSKSSDLASLRSRTVTAGINDVTADKVTQPASDAIAAVIDRLSADTYDRRIPQMVGSYFADMSRVIDGMEPHMQEAAPLLMDIGDSAYGGVHVDTPALLIDMLKARGWGGAREILLRKRMSRSGQALRQVLIVATPPAPKMKPISAPHWKRSWGKFKSELPHQTGDYAKRNWGNPLHSLCSYQGKMKPSLAHHLVRTFTRPGGVMLDPFGGVGTIPFEAAMMGVNTWAFDISPAAMPICLAKLSPAHQIDCERVLQELEGALQSYPVLDHERQSASELRFNGALPDYFHPDTFDEILKARTFFRKFPPTSPASALVFSALLHVLHGNRPYALSRRSHPITPFAPTGESQYKSLIEKVREKVQRSVAVDRSTQFVPGRTVFQDATAPWPQEIDGLDAVITSPPFFDSTRFYLANWMRLWFAGWSDRDFKERPRAFVDERQKGGFEVYEPILRQARERMNQSGVCVFHLGKSRKCDMAKEIQRIAKPWFSKSEIFGESVEHCESHGIRDKGTVVEHTYLVLY